MTLKTQMTSDLSAFFSGDEFAEAVIYTPSSSDVSPPAGDPVPIMVIMEETDPSIMDVAPPADSMVLHLLYSDVPDPQRGDTFTIESETWYLIENIGGGSREGTWKLLVSRSDKRRIG